MILQEKNSNTRKKKKKKQEAFTKLRENSYSIEPFDVSKNRHGLGNVGIIDAGFIRVAAHRVLSYVQPRCSFSPC